MNSKPNILIVDAAELNREVLTSILEKKYKCYFAQDGEEAIRMLSEGKRVYRLLLLNVMMPKVSGFGVMEHMTRTGMIENIPVIIVTEDSAHETMIRAYSLGAMDVILKPFVPEIVIKRIDNVVRLFSNKISDPLTGGYNRTTFIREADLWLEQVTDVTEYALLYFNIRNFRAVNELFGMENGDMVLRTFYEEVLEQGISCVMASRLESDHFTCIIRKDNLDLESLSKKMEKYMYICNKKVRLFARFGVYYIKEQLPVSKMIDRAKLANQSIVDESALPYAVYESDMRLNHVQELIEKRSDDGKKMVPISVNLSWMDFYDTIMMNMIMELLQKRDASKGKIRLEVTENEFADMIDNYYNKGLC